MNFRLGRGCHSRFSFLLLFVVVREKVRNDFSTLFSHFFLIKKMDYELKEMNTKIKSLSRFLFVSTFIA